MAADELKVRSEKLRKAGLAIAGIMGGVIVGIVALTVPFVLPALRKYCLPFVPATPIQTETVLRHIQGRTGRVVDLGSGDGRVVHYKLTTHSLYACTPHTPHTVTPPPHIPHTLPSFPLPPSHSHLHTPSHSPLHTPSHYRPLTYIRPLSANPQSPSTRHTCTVSCSQCYILYRIYDFICKTLILCSA